MSSNIRSWKVSYYLDEQKRWITGQLTCTGLDVRFVKEQALEQTNTEKGTLGDTATDGSKSEPAALPQIKYCDIKQVQKASSMLVFSAVTVEMQDGKVHWFSSLPDRHSVFNMLHHFARQSLTGGNTADVAVVDPASKTRIGQQLLRSAEDSERTLAGAAANLWHQGRQLANVSIHVQEMHEDLDVADRLLSGLNSWLGRWRLPPQYKTEEAVHITKADIPVEQDYEVLCSILSKSHWHQQQLCMLRTAKNSITILDMHQRPLHVMRFFELSRVFVVSPWEVVLTKHMAGKADVSVSVVGAALLPVLQLLQASVPHLVDYQTPPETSYSEDTAAGAEAQSGRVREDTGKQQKSHSQSYPSRTTQKSETGRVPNKGRQSKSTFHTDYPPAEEDSQMQQTVQQEGVSDAELRALSSHLGGLKMLAISVGEEVSTQNKVLGELNASVDCADSRIRDATQRMKRLM